jgi:anti-anti-sigma factor
MASIEGCAGENEIPEPPPGQLDMQVFVAGGEHTLRLSGELDMATQPLLANAIDGMEIESANLVTLDLRRLSFMDSVGMRAILVLQESCRDAAIELRIIPGPSAVQRVFEATGLLSRLPFRRA